MTGRTWTDAAKPYCMLHYLATDVHDPEVAGSNPAPATTEGAGNGAFRALGTGWRAQAFDPIVSSPSAEVVAAADELVKWLKDCVDAVGSLLAGLAVAYRLVDRWRAARFPVRARLPTCVRPGRSRSRGTKQRSEFSERLHHPEPSGDFGAREGGSDLTVRPLFDDAKLESFALLLRKGIQRGRQP